MSAKTRAASAIWLIGGTEDEFKTSKLPSRGDVLKVLFHHHDRMQLSLRHSIAKTSAQLLLIWEKARVPTKAPNHVIEHIRKLHSEWQNLKKHINRVSQTNQTNQQLFVDSMNELFDVAHRDAMCLIKIEEDRLFLEAQREKGRRGIMVGVDHVLALKEERVLKRKIAEINRIEKANLSIAAADVMDYCDLSPVNSDTSSESENEAEPSIVSTPRQRFRGKVTVVTPEVAAALDRTNISE